MNFLILWDFLIVFQFLFLLWVQNGSKWAQTGPKWAQMDQKWASFIWAMACSLSPFIAKNAAFSSPRIFSASARAWTLAAISASSLPTSELKTPFVACNSAISLSSTPRSCPESDLFHYRASKDVYLYLYLYPYLYSFVFLLSYLVEITNSPTKLSTS